MAYEDHKKGGTGQFWLMVSMFSLVVVGIIHNQGERAFNNGYRMTPEQLEQYVECVAMLSAADALTQRNLELHCSGRR